MKKTLIIIFLLVTSLVSSDKILIKGNWESKEYLENNTETPYSVLNMYFEVDKKDFVVGNFEYYYKWYSKIEDSKSFNSNIKNNVFYISFDSNFGGKNGKAKVTINKDCSLDWDLIKEPDGEYYAPYNAHLVVNKLEINNLCKDLKKQIVTFFQKTKLYKTPSEETITKMYLIAGDKADLLEEKIDEKGEKWYNILYHGKKDINAWIKVDENQKVEIENK